MAIRPPYDRNSCERRRLGRLSVPKVQPADPEETKRWHGKAPSRVSGTRWRPDEKHW